MATTANEIRAALMVLSDLASAELYRLGKLGVSPDDTRELESASRLLVENVDALAAGPAMRDAIAELETFVLAHGLQHLTGPMLHAQMAYLFDIMHGRWQKTQTVNLRPDMGWDAKYREIMGGKAGEGQGEE